MNYEQFRRKMSKEYSIDTDDFFKNKFFESFNCYIQEIVLENTDLHPLVGETFKLGNVLLSQDHYEQFNDETIELLNEKVLTIGGLKNQKKEIKKLLEGSRDSAIDILRDSMDMSRDTYFIDGFKEDSEEDEVFITFLEKLADGIDHSNGKGFTMKIDVKLDDDDLKIDESIYTSLDKYTTPFVNFLGFETFFEDIDEDTKNDLVEKFDNYFDFDGNYVSISEEAVELLQPLSEKRKSWNESFSYKQEKFLEDILDEQNHILKNKCDTYER